MTYDVGDYVKFLADKTFGRKGMTFVFPAKPKNSAPAICRLCAEMSTVGSGRFVFVVYIYFSDKKITK